MIRDLDTLLDGKHHGLRELRAELVDLLGGSGVRGRLLEATSLSRTRVYRLRFEIEGQPRSLVVKRLPLYLSDRERLLTRTWLPEVEMSAQGPPLIGIALERRGTTAWHIYDDLGPHALAESISDPSKVAAAVERLAQVHSRFVRHPLLAECRLVGEDLGVQFFEASLRDARRSIQNMLLASNVDARGRAAAARLRERLELLTAEQSRRSQMWTELGGPETLVHGDLWTTNVLVIQRDGDLDVRLIDWDHCGVGPLVYDLSTFLRHFPAVQRMDALEAYRRCARIAGWTWPTLTELNALFETAELARYVNTIIWHALAVRKAAPDPAPEWAVQDLEEIDDWFEGLSPLLPIAETPGARGESAAA